jgi:hypothetical protein
MKKVVKKVLLSLPGVWVLISCLVKVSDAVAGGNT